VFFCSFESLAAQKMSRRRISQRHTMHNMPLSEQDIESEKLKKFGPFVWHNGEIKPSKDATVHMLTHGLHYGTSVFEGIRCYETGSGVAIFRLQEHIRRLMYSMQSLGLSAPHTEEEFTQGCCDIIRANGTEACYLRPIVFSGFDDLGLSPSPLEAGIATRPWDTYYKDLAGQVSDVRRLSPSAFDPHAKIGGHYVNPIRATARMQHANPGKTPIMLDEHGYIAELPAANIFMRQGNKLHTPTPSSILPGITRDTILRVGKDMGVPIVERDIEPTELEKATEIFVTGTAAEIVPMIEVNGRRLNGGIPGQFSTLFSQKYRQIVMGKARKYDSWLTRIER
jgi:branched-chain amino acid aminotransferase